MNVKNRMQPQLWMNLQKTCELRVAELESGKQIAKRVKPRQAAASRKKGPDPNIDRHWIFGWYGEHLGPGRP